MRFILPALAIALLAPTLPAQRHSERSSPPTAPLAPPPAPVVPVSTGLGAIQFVQVNFGVPAPQALSRQLRFDDERTRSAALSAIGAPGQYLAHGHIPMPRTVDLELAPLGTGDDLDALLTVELDQHIVTAVLIPVDGNWRRIATLIFAVPFDNTTVTPDAWVLTARSFMEKDRYRAVFHASTGSLNGNFSENEAHLRIINNKAVITLSFESTARECTLPTTPAHPAPTPAKPTNTRPVTPAPAAKPGCDFTQRWFQPDPADPTKRFQLISATGHISPKEVDEPLADTRPALQSHLRTFTCQPYIYSDANQRYEPSAPNAPCPTK